MKRILLALSFFAIITSIFANSALAAACPSDASRVKGTVNPIENSEGFYKILQNDISMGVILRGVEQSIQAGGYRFISESAKTVIQPRFAEAGSFAYFFTLTRSAVKLNTKTPLGHNIHMPDLTITGEINIKSLDQVEACISNIEIQNTSFGHL